MSFYSVKKCLFTCFLCMSFAVSLTYPLSVSAKQEVYPDKYAALVMDSDTGLILYQRNGHKKLHPASLTKMMTLLMLFEALDQGKVRMHSKIRISEHAASMVPSKIGLKPGKKIKVKDAIQALAVKSANDIAVAVAEKLGGSERRFAQMMTKKARDLGMTKTRFRNASGLHDPKQVSTARDMARLARTIIYDYPHYYHFFSKNKFTYQGKTYRSHNKLMNSYAGMDGMKTGYIRASGFNLVSSAKRNNRRLIGVVFGGKTSKTRNARMEKILDFSFKRIGGINIVASAAPVPKRKPANDHSVAQQPAFAAPLPPKKKVNWSRWAMLDAMKKDSMIHRMAGEGDYDSSVRSRVETGLISISAHMGEGIPSYTHQKTATKKIIPSREPTKQAAFYAATKQESWSIQVGAYTSRERTNKALARTINKLPLAYKEGKATIAPRQTKTGWIYRARIEGYTKSAAKEACALLNDCIVLSASTK